MRLQDKIAIITGGGQGIGRAYALRFAREGAKVVVADIQADKAEAVVEEIRSLGGESMSQAVDVASEESCQRLAAAVAERFGCIDILVNNAAIYHGLDRTNQSIEYLNRILAVNLTGALVATRAVAPYMKRQHKGKIILQSSTAAYMGNVAQVDTSNPDIPLGSFHYSVAKMGLNGYTKYFAGALGPWGINVNAIAPGLTLTDATRAVVPDAYIGMLVNATSLKRALQPEDLTGTAVYLASEDSDMMTGQVLVVDGGMIMLG